MSENNPKCVFCGRKKEKIIFFVEKTLKKSQEFLKIRKKFNLKYSNSKLPENVNSTDGYHKQCYSSYTALMPRYRNSYSDVASSCPNTSSSTLNSSTINKINTINKTNQENKIPEAEINKKKIYKSIFKNIVLKIEEEVIKKKCPLLLSSLCDLYNYKLTHELKIQSESDASLMTNHELKEEIVKHFKKKIKILNNDKKNIIVHPDCNSLEDDDLVKLEEMDLIEKAALILRKTILEIKSEFSIPEKLNEFFKVLIGGRDFQREDINLDNLSNSMASDLIFCVSNGAVVPPKHIALGKTVKNSLNSREIIETLNKLGHCCEYKILEKLETQASVSAVQNHEEEILDAEEMHQDINYNSCDKFNGKNIIVSENFNELSPPLKKKKFSGVVVLD